MLVMSQDGQLVTELTGRSVGIINKLYEKGFRVVTEDARGNIVTLANYYTNSRAEAALETLYSRYGAKETVFKFPKEKVVEDGTD